MIHNLEKRHSSFACSHPDLPGVPARCCGHRWSMPAHCAGRSMPVVSFSVEGLCRIACNLNPLTFCALTLSQGYSTLLAEARVRISALEGSETPNSTRSSRKLPRHACLQLTLSNIKKQIFSSKPSRFSKRGNLLPPIL